jgi:NH3-dependent NAD+ synthetase
MIEPTVRFPVVCPKCGREKLTEFPINEVVYALKGGSDITLVATCHDVIWTATEQELEQIHEYLLVLKGGSDEKIEPSRDAPPLPYRSYKYVGQLS